VENVEIFPSQKIAFFFSKVQNSVKEKLEKSFFNIFKNYLIFQHNGIFKNQIIIWHYKCWTWPWYYLVYVCMYVCTYIPTYIHTVGQGQSSTHVCQIINWFLKIPSCWKNQIIIKFAKKKISLLFPSQNFVLWKKKMQFGGGEISTFSTNNNNNNNNNSFLKT
jgi:hypothetical protein